MTILKKVPDDCSCHVCSAAEGYRCHIWVRSFLRSRGIFPSRDRTPPRPHSCTLVHSRHQRCPVHTLGQDGGLGSTGGVSSGRRNQPCWTHSCGSERRGIPGDRRTGRLPGDRKLRVRSHTAAGRKDRRDQEDKLRMTDQHVGMV